MNHKVQRICDKQIYLDKTSPILSSSSSHIQKWANFLRWKFSSDSWSISGPNILKVEKSIKLVDKVSKSRQLVDNVVNKLEVVNLLNPTGHPEYVIRIMTTICWWLFTFKKLLIRMRMRMRMRMRWLTTFVTTYNFCENLQLIYKPLQIIYEVVSLRMRL